MISLITLGLVVLLIYVYYKFAGSSSSLPQGLRELPCEKGLPIIGMMHGVKISLAWHLKNLSAIHGPLFKIKMGMRDVVVICNYDIMKKAVKEDGDTFSGRLQLEMIKQFTHDSGIVFKDGEHWAKQRSFVLTVLRDFGLGKSRAMEIIQNECQYLLDELEKFDGKSLNFSKLILYSTGNIISKFIMSKRFIKGDPRIMLIDRLVHDQARERDYGRLFFTMFPALDSSWLFQKFTGFFSDRVTRFDEVYQIFRMEIQKHSKCLDLNSEGEDLIDRFLLKQHEMRKKTGTEDTFTEWQLIRVILELFSGGYETTSTTLGWACLFLSRYPEIQEKVHAEIVDKIGEERTVVMNDKVELHYTQAVMDEIVRLSSVLPLGLPHRTLDDSSVDGYFIPKNSVIFTNLLACHIDPLTWESPMQFSPERFLSEDSQGIRRYTPRKELIPFGIGKRQCLGESLARMEYFIFFTSIFQKFEVSFAEAVSDQEYEKALLANEGIVRFSAIKNFTFKSRQLKNY